MRWTNHLLLATAVICFGCRSGSGGSTPAEREKAPAATGAPNAELAGQAAAGSTNSHANAVPAEYLGKWQALSNTAMAITGPVEVQPAAVMMKGTSFGLERVRQLTDAEEKTLGPELLIGGTRGVLATVEPNSNPVLLHGNKLCTRTPAWLAMMLSKNGLSVAFFQNSKDLQGSHEPPLGGPALANSTDLCGTFSYFRP